MDSERSNSPTASASEVDDSLESGAEVEDQDFLASYSDLHRLILQGFMAHGILEANPVRHLFRKAYERFEIQVAPNDEMKTIAQIVGDINAKISPLNLIIKSAVDEFTGKSSYMFTVTVESAVVRFQSYFSKTEVEFFAKSLSAIIGSQDFTISVLDCLNLVPGMLDVAEEFLEKMTQHTYFTKVQTVGGGDDDVRITLGIRGILEMESVITADHPDVLASCVLCKKTMLHGKVCRKCSCAVHGYCYSKYVQESKACPRCKGPWSLDSQVAQRRKVVPEAAEEPDR